MKKGQILGVTTLLLLTCMLTGFLYWMSQSSSSIIKDQSQSQPAKQDLQKTQLDTPRNSENQPLKQTAPSPKPVKFIKGTENLPKSLQGTDVDGEIIIDANKQLVVTNGLRRLFDYFLTTQGEEPTEDIIARVEAYINHRVPEPARSQAIALFHKYTDYLQALTKVPEAGGKSATDIDINAVIEQKKNQATLQRKYFDQATIQAFFASEAVYDDYHIKLLQIQKDPTLSDVQKLDAQKQAFDAIPDTDLKQQIQAQKNYANLITQTKALKSKGASKDDIRVLREQLVGKNAAERLERLDERREIWQTKVQKYLDDRAIILTSDMTEYEKETAIRELKYRDFTETEQKRLLAYEQLGKASIH